MGDEGDRLLAITMCKLLGIAQCRSMSQSVGYVAMVFASLLML